MNIEYREDACVMNVLRRSGCMCAKRHRHPTILLYIDNNNIERWKKPFRINNISIHMRNGLVKGYHFLNKSIRNVALIQFTQTANARNEISFVFFFF